jgi:D-alanyl-D-alanine carboxypeptidase
MPAADVLLNTSRVEAWPGGLLRARGNQDARWLAGAAHVLRRKRDGCYLAVERDGVLQPLRPRFRNEPGLREAVTALRHWRAHRRSGFEPVARLPLDRLQERLQVLGLDADDYAARTGLDLVPEPAWLALAGFDRYRRPLWLHASAAPAWQRLQAAALRDAVVLEAISAYRSHDYQLGIFERKLARGQSVGEILTVNAAPGFSEHHGGLALDIGTPGEPPAEASFEATPAFAWLQENAASFGFALSYPRGNPHGITYEPWHWAYTAD